MMGGRRVRGIVAAISMTFGVGLLCSGAAAASPAWRIDALSNSTAAPGGTLDYLVQVTNVGTDSDGGPLDLVATLPPGVTAVSTANASAGASFSCTGSGGSPIAGASVVTCTETDVVPAHGFRILQVTVAIAPSLTETVVTSSFQVSGGGAAAASTVDPTRITATAPSFGVDAFDGQIAADPDGAPFTQAGGHPYAVSLAIDLNTATNPDPPFGPLWPVEPARDAIVDLPAGLIVNPIDAAQCTAVELANAQGAEPEPLCPPSSQVGTTLVRLNDLPGPVVLGPLPVFNMEPTPDEPARFGFNVAGTVVTLDARLRSESDYGLTLTAADLPQALALAGMSLTLWGTPSDSTHDADRPCPGQPNPWRGGSTCASGAPLRAMLRNTTYCGTGPPTTLSVDSWTHPDAFQSATSSNHAPPGYPSPPSAWGAQLMPTGCDKVPFDPTLTVAPASPAQAGQPDAFSFDLSLPQGNDSTTIGESDLNAAVIALPEGVRPSPFGANELAGCSPAQIGLGTTDEPTCPDASKIGSATITTPLLSEQMTGSAYLASDHPFSKHLIYVVVKGPGLIVKLPWYVRQPDPGSDHLEVIVEFPQMPISDLHLELSGGPHAWMQLPDACGIFTTNALVVSWSGHELQSPGTFEVSEGAGGGPCSPPTPPPPPTPMLPPAPTLPLPPTPGGTPSPSSPGPVAASPPASRSTPQAGVTRVGRTRVRDGAVLVPLACSGGSGCSIVATLSVVERIRRGGVVGIAVRTHRYSAKVGVVGRASTDLAAGQRKTLRVGLNRLGRRLLRRFGKLRATLRVAQDGETVKTRGVLLIARHRRGRAGAHGMAGG
jgi:hypothetical protein